MKTLTLTLALGAVLTAPIGAAQADDLDGLTLRVMQGDRPEAVTQRIELPRQLRDQARDRDPVAPLAADQTRDRDRDRIDVPDQDRDRTQDRDRVDVPDQDRDRDRLHDPDQVKDQDRDRTRLKDQTRDAREAAGEQRQEMMQQRQEVREQLRNQVGGK